jgi:uncharacterized HAD superfamily protein
MADKNKISFDFDDTLSTAKGQTLAKQFIDEGKTVYIITARQRRMSEGVYEIADELGIPHTRIYFTNGADKWETIKRLGIGIHYDNNKEQIDKINANTECEGRLFTA